jgi:hypothetical protein
MAAQYRVPGVYYEPQPRAAEAVPVRTDVCGFIGFEPRIRAGASPFCVDISGFQVALGGTSAVLPRSTNFPLFSPPQPPTLLDGQSIFYTVAAALPLNSATATTVVAQGVVAAYGMNFAATDDAVAGAVVGLLPGPRRPWVRIVDVEVRSEQGAIYLTVHPTLKATRCDDWSDYLLAFGSPGDDGALLAPAVRAYFANGGARCWIATVRRPVFDDAVELEHARQDMIGVAGTSENDATGLERLLLVPEVTLTDAPDLYMQRLLTVSASIPPPRGDPCFRPCSKLAPPPTGTSEVSRQTSGPLFAGDAIAKTQRGLIELARDQRWRMLVLLSVPFSFDPVTGTWAPPATADADQCRNDFDSDVKLGKLADTTSISCAALYWPWVLNQEQVDGPVVLMPPSAYAAGVIARRDLARGPQFSPANETLKQVVATTTPVDDDANALLYAPPADKNGTAKIAVNVLRAFPGYGIQVWGARTMSTDPWLQFIVVRRTLTAVELRMKAALEMLVFEPNTPALWMHITHVALGVLLPLYESGALRGSRPEEAFYIRCDATVNTADTIAQGWLFVEVGVAVAAPAEFIVFRVGRREGAVEVVE